MIAAHLDDIRVDCLVVEKRKARLCHCGKEAAFTPECWAFFSDMSFVRRSKGG